MYKKTLLCAGLGLWLGAAAQQTDTVKTSTLGEVSIQARAEGMSRIGGAENGMQIGQGELFRAACCNLGESFVTNPSVDVNYNDAAVGARQIKLLGLSGQYVQMLTETQPASTGATLPYSLGYVPGAWMKSISVSKGASSVKNGPQSITGQINVEYLKPDDEPAVQFNLYGDSRRKTEFNAAVNRHLNSRLSTVLLAHYEHDFAHHDADGDLWHDSPNVRQLHLMNRWKYVHGRYIMHAGLGYLQEEREGGQLLKVEHPFRILLDARRAEAYMKHAYLLNQEHNTNIALLANGSFYRLDGTFGPKSYGVDQLDFNSQLLLEHDFTADHSLSTGLSLNAERLDEAAAALHGGRLTEEYTPGLYAQYTFTPSYRFTAMGGIRLDYSSLYQRAYVTPRVHLKWLPAERLTLRASAGKGFRTPHALAENHYLLASGRTLDIDSLLPQEEAWNTGISAALYIPVGERNLQLSAEYYYTHFLHQAVVDYETPLRLAIHDLDGRSFSHTLQLEASYEFSDALSLLAAFRLNHVRCTYGGTLLEKPLQSRYKGLLTLGWKPMMGIWQLDITLALNGGGRMPAPYTLPDGTPSWDDEFPAYPQLNVQLTREFRHFSLYLGGENLTHYRQPSPIILADDPYSPSFEPTLIWGPVHGIMAYAGLRTSF
ncbi:MAG: TonB-dependent receptor [Bacteroidales bacterium]|nr:TonB-dependent receptor [Bacteroidales bacterium]